jgi:TolA-binding protein
MLKARKKITHKEIKKDKLVTTYFETKEWFSSQENRKKLFMGLGIVAVLVIAVFFYMSNRKTKNEEAEVKLSTIISIYEQGNYLLAISGDPSQNIIGLNDIVNNYGSTESGQSARFYLANCQYNLKDYDNALKNFEDYSGKNDILKASCLSGIGAIYEAKGDLKKAAEFYEKSSKVNKDLVINQENLFYALRCFANAGDKENAKRLLSTLKNEYPKSRYINDTKRFESEFKN